MLGNLYTGSDELQTAKKYASEYPRILAAIERLEELHQVLKIYGIDKYVSVELGIVSNYQYYTGIIFAGYTFGSGEPIVKGGRYDELLTYFGKESASIGFAIVIDQHFPDRRSKFRYNIRTNLLFMIRKCVVRRSKRRWSCVLTAEMWS